MNMLPLGGLGRVARVISLVMLGYWALFALLAPVMTVDSQMYNLARIHLAAEGGLFGNALFTSVFHVIMPWGFDAVHLPFLYLGWGFALPSFACLGGICFVAHRMIRDRFGPDAAWVAVLGLLGLTCLVYQGTSTKNDIPLVFAGAVWIYARWRWRREGGAAHLFWMVLAVGFMSGVKTTGVPFAALLGLWTLWQVRRQRRVLGGVLAGLLFAGVLFGSVETYVETWRIYRDPLGPETVAGPLRNRDGMAGAAANLSRYFARGVYWGPTTGRDGPAVVAWWSGVERSLLKVAGLSDRGASPQFRDGELFLFQSGQEELSGYGPGGTWAVGILLLACVWIRPRRVWWRLSAGAWCVFGTLSLAVAYTDWANRYVLGGYVLAICAVVCLLWERDGPVARVARGIFFVIAAVGAIGAPLGSHNRGPRALADCLVARERLETSAFPLAGAVRAKLRELKQERPDSRVYFVVCNDSVILPLMEDRRIDPILATPPTFAVWLASGEVRAGDLVIEDYSVALDRLSALEKVIAPDAFSADGVRSQIIYRVVGAGATSATQ